MRTVLLLIALFLASCNSSPNVRTHSSSPRRAVKDTTTTQRTIQKVQETEPDSEVRFTEIQTELTVSIPQTIYKNLKLKVVANNPQTLTEVTEYINSNLENLRFIASDEDLKSELDRILKEKFEGDASITVIGNKVIQPVDSTKVAKQRPEKPVDTKVYHTVKKGEGFLGIARKYNISVNTLYKLNPGKKSLSQGDKLRIN